MLCSPRFCDVGFPVAIDMKKKVRVDLNLHLICRQVLRGKRPALCHVNVEEQTEGKKTGLKTRWCALNRPFQKQIQNVVCFVFFSQRDDKALWETRASFGAWWTG